MRAWFPKLGVPAFRALRLEDHKERGVSAAAHMPYYQRTREICWRNPPPSLRALGPLPSFVRFNFGNKPIPTRHQQANPHRHNNFSCTRMRKLWVRGAAGSGREIRNVTRVKDASPGVPCARSRRTWYASSQSEMKNVADRRKERRRRREKTRLRTSLAQ